MKYAKLEKSRIIIATNYHQYETALHEFCWKRKSSFS